MRVFAIPLRTRFRGITTREGVLLRGEDGRWGEWSPFLEYDARVAEPWLRCAEESAAGDWPAPVRDRILAETRGNPLALLELPRGLTPTQLAGGFGTPDAPDLSSRIETSYIRRLELLPEDARRELDRIRTRWAQLPLERAEVALPRVRDLLGVLAARTVGASGATVPDLGPALVPDQLAVLVWDACAAGAGDDVTDLLADLRRALP